MKTQFVSMKELQHGKITTQLATQWIKREQHLLINSQTGSGKTTGLMSAALNLADSNTSEFYIFTAPTINLCEQVFKDHPNGTLLLTGKVKNKTELIEQHINKGHTKLFEEFVFVPFPKNAPFYECLLTYIYERVKNGYKILLYLQSIKKNVNLVNKLNNIGISAICIDASTKEDNTAYQNIVNHSSLPKDYDVVISTSLLSEGISINIADDDKVEIAVVAHNQSKFFNPFTIEQISNRIRQPYARFSILSENLEDYENYNNQLYDYEKEFQYLKLNALKAKEKLEKSVKKSSLIASNLVAQCERTAYLIAQNNLIVVDELKILHDVFQKLELYYQKNRYAFYYALKLQFQLNSLEVITFHSRTDIEQRKQADTEEKNLCALDLRHRFKKENFEFLYKNKQQFDFYICKLEITAAEKNMLKALIPYTSSYELLMKIVDNNNTVIKVNQLIDAINGFVELENLKLSKLMNFTTLYISNIENLAGTDFHSAQELKSILNYAHKYTKSISNNTVPLGNKMLKIYFYKEEKRSNSQRLYKLKLHTVDTLAAQFKLTVPEIKILIKHAIANSDFTNKDALKIHLNIA